MDEPNRRITNDVLTAARSAAKQLDTLVALLNQLDPKDPDVDYHDIFDARSAVDSARSHLAGVERLSIKWGAQ